MADGDVDVAAVGSTPKVPEFGGERYVRRKCPQRRSAFTAYKTASCFVENLVEVWQ